MNYTKATIAGLTLASLLAISPAFADKYVVKQTDEAVTISADQVTRDLLKKANAEAAEKAVEAVLADTKLDLDIRLIGPTSVKVASDR